MEEVGALPDDQHRLHSAIPGVTNGKDLFAALRREFPAHANIHKGRDWGARLTQYAWDHPSVMGTRGALSKWQKTLSELPVIIIKQRSRNAWLILPLAARSGSPIQDGGERTMTEYVVFRSTVRERVTLPAHSQVQLFQEIPTAAQRVTTSPEAALVAWLVRDRDGKRLLCEALKRDSPLFRPLVTTPFLKPGDKPGDIDLFVCEQDHPDQAAVIEWKRVKVTTLDARTNAVNKLDNLADGVRQANQLLPHGFFQTYLGIIIAVDAASQRHYNVPNRGVAPNTTHYGNAPTFGRLFDFPDRDRLHRHIGIIFLELVQPTSRSIDDLVNISICVHYPATPQRQRNEVTNRVAEYLHNAYQFAQT